MGALHDRIHQLATIVVEVEARRRPLRHLQPFIHPSLQGRLSGVLDQHDAVPHVRTVRAQRVGDRIEAVALLAGPRGRVEALLLTLEPDEGRWLVTHLARPGRRPVCTVPIEPGLTMRGWADAGAAHRPETEAPALPSGWTRAA